MVTKRPSRTFGSLGSRVLGRSLLDSTIPLYDPAVVHPLISLVLVLLVAGAVAVVVAVAVMARAAPAAADDRRQGGLGAEALSPGDLGLLFDDVKFDVRDERSGEKLTIAAWWIPHPRAAGRCAVLVHGYADAKVGSIAWAPTWHAGNSTCSSSTSAPTARAAARSAPAGSSNDTTSPA